MKGLLFKPWKAQAIHDNPEREWQTRRLIKPQPPDGWTITPTMVESVVAMIRLGDDGKPTERGDNIKCPYSIGEQAYIKETHYRVGCWLPFFIAGKPRWRFIPISDDILFENTPPITVCHGRLEEGWYKRPSLFLPADLARTVATIKDIRAQRVQDISEKDARAEGCKETRVRIGNGIHWESARGNFCLLWDSIHGEGAWKRNDFVWKYGFKAIEVLR